MRMPPYKQAMEWYRERDAWKSDACNLAEALNELLRGVWLDHPHWAITGSNTLRASEAIVAHAALVESAGNSIPPTGSTEVAEEGET